MGISRVVPAIQCDALPLTFFASSSQQRDRNPVTPEVRSCCSLTQSSAVAVRACSRIPRRPRCPHPFPAARASCCSASTQDAHASGPCPRLSSHPDYSALSGHVANPSVPPGLDQVSFHPLPQPALPVPQPCLGAPKHRPLSDIRHAVRICSRYFLSRPQQASALPERRAFRLGCSLRYLRCLERHFAHRRPSEQSHMQH